MDNSPSVARTFRSFAAVTHSHTGSVGFGCKLDSVAEVYIPSAVGTAFAFAEVVEKTCLSEA